MGATCMHTAFYSNFHSNFLSTQISVIHFREKRAFVRLHTCHRNNRPCTRHACHSKNFLCTSRQCCKMVNISPSCPCLLLEGEKAEIRLFKISFAYAYIWASRSTILLFENSPITGISDVLANIF